jgi:gamma-glutamyltranspeptidase
MFQLKRAHAAVTILAAALISGAAVLIAHNRPLKRRPRVAPSTRGPAVAGINGIVTSGHPIASSAGLQMLLKGGNAFDAAVAVGAMAALGEPEMNGIGGNGFMTIFDKKTARCTPFDGRSGAEGAQAGGDDARDTERRHEGRYRARKSRRLSFAASNAWAR